MSVVNCTSAVSCTSTFVYTRYMHDWGYAKQDIYERMPHHKMNPMSCVKIQRERWSWVSLALKAIVHYLPLCYDNLLSKKKKYR